MAFFTLRNVNKSFGSFQALNDVTFSAEKGEVVSIIGSSGSGKTTLLRCINFLESVDSGEFFLDGETMFSGPIDKLTEDEKRAKRLSIGLVFQSFNLFPHYSILRNVTLAPELLIRESLKRKGKKKDRPKIYDGIVEYYFQGVGVDEKKINEIIQKKGTELLTKVGLESKINAYPHQLSGGQQQRAAIARAIALNPSLLCFDEPTSALDPELTGEVLRVIKALKSKDRAMIIVTHEMEFAKSVSDKVVFMSQGEIVEAGTPQEIFEDPKTTALKNFLSATKKKEGDEDVRREERPD